MEWLTTLIGTLFTGAVTFGVCLINNNAQMRKRDIEQDKYVTEIKNELHEQILELSAAYQQSTALLTYKLDEVDKKVHLHNQVVERVYKLESKTDLHDEKFKALERRQA